MSMTESMMLEFFRELVVGENKQTKASVQSHEALARSRADCIAQFADLSGAKSSIRVAPWCKKHHL
jgi:hypothetical protein